MSNKILPDFKPGMTVSNEVKGSGKILITINEERKAFIAWADGSRSWVGFGDLVGWHRCKGCSWLTQLDQRRMTFSS